MAGYCRMLECNKECIQSLLASASESSKKRDTMPSVKIRGCCHHKFFEKNQKILKNFQLFKIENTESKK